MDTNDTSFVSMMARAFSNEFKQPRR